MCFSASASFTTSAALLVVGSIIVKKVKNRHHLLIAMIPYFFAIQQFFEGVLWLNILDTPHIPSSIISKNIFLFFVFIFWPIWIPLSLFIAESQKPRKELIGVCLGTGIALSAFLAMIIPDTTAMAYKNSIQYLFNLQSLHRSLEDRLYSITLLSYGIATVVPLFITSIKKTYILGIFIAISAIAIHYIDQKFFVSMWCFFAAVISLGILFILSPNIQFSNKD